MSMTIIIKNSTQDPIMLKDLFGVTIPVSGQVELFGDNGLFRFYEVASSLNLKSCVTIGDLVVNDGTEDLSISNGLKHLEIKSEYATIDVVQNESHELDDHADVPLKPTSGIKILESQDGVLAWGESLGNISYHYKNSDESESSTTSTEYQTKLTLNANGLSAGIYRIGYNYEWNHYHPGSNYIGRIQIDNDTVISSQVEKPKNGNSDEWGIFSGFCYVELTAGDHFIDIDYATNQCGKASKIRRARLEIWRVS